MVVIFLAFTRQLLLGNNQLKKLPYSIGFLTSLQTLQVRGTGLKLRYVLGLVGRRTGLVDVESRDRNGQACTSMLQSRRNMLRVRD